MKTLLNLISPYNSCSVISNKWHNTLLQTESALARTGLSLGRCTLGVNRHSPAIFDKIYYAITACMT